MQRRISLLHAGLLVAAAVGGLVACAPSGYSGTSASVDTVSAAAVPSTAPTVHAIPPPPPPPDRPPLKTTAELIERMVLYSSKTSGAVLTSLEWQDFSDYICNDLAAGGAGLFTPESANGLTEAAKLDLSTMYLDGAIKGNCTTAVTPPAPPGVVYKTDFSLALPTAIRGEFTNNDIAYSKLLRAYMQELVAYGTEYHVDVSGLLDALPNPFGGSGGGGSSGYPVTCADGWVSQSGGRQGACSHHGGIG